MEWTADFPKATEAQWRAAVDRALKGADFERTLVGRTADGIAIMPLAGHRADARTIAGARGAARWGIVARLDDPDTTRGNAQIHEDLLGGADSVVLAFAGAPGARGFGLRDHSPSTFEHALAGIHCDLIHLRLETPPFGGRAVAEGFAAYARRQRLPGTTLNVDFGLQPLADFIASGRMPLPLATVMGNLHDVIGLLQDDGFAGPFIRCDGRALHEAGASEAQELAGVIAQGASYLRGLAERGVPLAEAAAHLSFTLAADDDQLLTIAKFRALRLLWGRIEEVCGIAPRAIPVHAETAWRMLSRRDPYVNLLRATIATFAAGVGGADSIDVLPFTAAFGLPDGAARRLARNTSLILTEESNLHRVVDPAAGAGGIEALTEALCEKAWGLFQFIEQQRHDQEAGLMAALSNGFLAEMIRDTRDGRFKEIATRKHPLTGVSEFPNINEAPVEILAPSVSASIEVPFPSIRLSEPFEILRDRADALRARGRRPRVFLANLGRVADFTARTTFAKNAFEAGGIEAIANDGFAEGTGTDLVAMTDAFKASGAMLACIASSDALYEAEAADAALALVASGAKAVYLAGKPGANETALRAAGVSGFIFARCDMLAFLDDALRHEEGEA
jgi:methylmalonyl-CoA mutase